MLLSREWIEIIWTILAVITLQPIYDQILTSISTALFSHVLATVFHPKCNTQLPECPMALIIVWIFRCKDGTQFLMKNKWQIRFLVRFCGLLGLRSFWQHLAQNAQSSAAHHIWTLVGYPSSSHAGETQNSSPLICYKMTNTQTISMFPKIPDSTRGKTKQWGKQTKFPYPSSSPSPSARKTSNEIAKPENRCKQKQEIKNNVNRLKSVWTTQMVPNHPFDGWNSSQTQSTSKHLSTEHLCSFDADLFVIFPSCHAWQAGQRSNTTRRFQTQQKRWAGT